MYHTVYYNIVDRFIDNVYYFFYNLLNFIKYTFYIITDK